MCIKSLELYHDDFKLKVIVINDASNKNTTNWLKKFCSGKKNFILIENSLNQGYTKSTNKGLKFSKARYVITLNSDTCVTPGWLYGMHNCLASSSKIGIVGPLSNAASWQSVPDLMDENGFKINQLPQGMTPNKMAELVTKVSKKNFPKVNVINGFCFMIKRSLIEKIGYLDEVNFPTGYGEENDYCIRAKQAGYELAIADNAYVYHSKSKSFGHANRKNLSKQGSETLHRLYGKKIMLSLTMNLKNEPSLQKIRQSLTKQLKIIKK